jgi:hypothetical protein
LKIMDIYSRSWTFIEDHGHLLKIPVYKKPHINKISPANRHRYEVPFLINPRSSIARS